MKTPTLIHVRPVRQVDTRKEPKVYRYRRLILSLVPQTQGDALSRKYMESLGVITFRWGKSITLEDKAKILKRYGHKVRTI